MTISERLSELSRNLYWAWHPDVIGVFRDLDPGLWREVNHNPVVLLSRLADAATQGNLGQADFEARLTQVTDQVRRYLESRDVWGAWNAGLLRVRPVAYFSAEFGIHESLPLYSGGLGVLAGDHLKAASDLGVPLVGVGLLYAKGYFEQSLDRNGWQQEHYRGFDARTLPLEAAMDANGQPLRVSVDTDSREIKLGIWVVRVGRNRLLLLDSNVDGNSEGDRALTAQLYGGDRNTRIRQEIILGIGGMRALRAMDIVPGVIHMNEGHSAFAVLELIRQLMERDGQSFRNLQEIAASRTVFTTHTPIEAGHDRFEQSQLEQALGVFRRQLGISTDELMALGRVEPGNRAELFCMTVLGLNMSRYRNGVSALHGHISRAMWRKVWRRRRMDEVPIGYITNGVHTGTWLAEPMRRFYDHYLGEGWEDRMDDPRTWAAVDQIDDGEFWKRNDSRRQSLVEYVRRNVRRQAEARGESDPTCGESRPCLDPAILTVGYARRFVPYKRSYLIFKNQDRLDRLVNDPHRPMQIIFAGKAHPNDDAGKGSIQRVFEIAKDPRFNGRIVFVENYNINVARHLVQGVDVWLNTPRRPLEACGTSGQKVAINAGLNLSVLDGWWAEAYDGENGFAIGQGSEHSDWDQQDRIDEESLYNVLESQVVPLFYERDSNGVARGWVAKQKHALRTLAWRFSARRMMMDYTLGCYLPAAGGLTASRTAAAPFLAPPNPVRPTAMSLK